MSEKFQKIPKNVKKFQKNVKNVYFCLFLLYFYSFSPTLLSVYLNKYCNCRPKSRDLSYSHQDLSFDTIFVYIYRTN